MRQQKITLEQLAEEVADFIEPVIPCLVIGSKRADEEAGKKAGPEVWAARKKLWEKILLGCLVRKTTENLKYFTGERHFLQLAGRNDTALSEGDFGRMN